MQVRFFAGRMITKCRKARASLQRYYLDEAARYLGLSEKKEDSILGARFSLFEEDDSSIQIDTLDTKTRARIKTNGEGAKDDQKVIQEMIRLGGSLHLKDDFLAIHLDGATGDKITDRFTQISGGENQQFHFNFRNLYAELQPIEGAKFTVGSFYPYYGLGSQVTLKDADSYLTGYRMQLNVRKLLESSFGKFIERVTAESTFFGDKTRENVFHRGVDRLVGDNNSNSVLVESAEFLDGFKLAVGFERFDHSDFLPLQASWKIGKIFIKDIVAQSMVEVGNDESYAVGVHVRSQPVTKLIIQAGFTIVTSDFDYPHDEKYPAGERFDVTITYALPYGFSLEGFYSDEFKHIDDLENIRAEFSVIWDAVRFYDEWAND